MLFFPQYQFALKVAKDLSGLFGLSGLVVSTIAFVKLVLPYRYVVAMSLEKQKDSMLKWIEDPMRSHTLTHTYHCVRIRVEVIFMATNLQIDDKLITKAVDLGHHRTKKAAVTQALINYILHLEQENILSLFGSIDFTEGYDYKKQRSRT